MNRLFSIPRNNSSYKILYVLHHVVVLFVAFHQIIIYEAKDWKKGKGYSKTDIWFEIGVEKEGVIDG